MSAITQGPYRVSGRMGATSRDGLVGLFCVVDTRAPYDGVLVGYAHSKADADMLASAPTLSAQVATLTAERDALRKAVEAAYREGWEAGVSAVDSYGETIGYVDNDWRDSAARAALEGGRP